MRFAKQKNDAWTPKIPILLIDSSQQIETQFFDEWQFSSFFDHFLSKCTTFSSFLLNAFVQSPLGCDFDFNVWLESVKQLGSDFLLFVFLN